MRWIKKCSVGWASFCWLAVQSFLACCSLSLSPASSSTTNECRRDSIHSHIHTHTHTHILHTTRQTLQTTTHYQYNIPNHHTHTHTHNIHNTHMISQTRTLMFNLRLGFFSRNPNSSSHTEYNQSESPITRHKTNVSIGIINYYQCN